MKNTINIIILLWICSSIIAQPLPPSSLPTEPLPVELTSFSADLSNASEVILNWNTATEVNNYGFEIQRKSASNQLAEFKVIGFVEGNGNSNSPKEYTFTDAATLSGVFSYRLKQIDLDGGYSYSNIITVEVIGDMSTIKEYKLGQNYPNPFNPSTNIDYTVSSNEYVSLKVYDILGNEIATLVNEKKEAGNYKVEFNAANFSSGLYLYKIQAGTFTQVRKMMLLK